jgi:hypothetical protein
VRLREKQSRRLLARLREVPFDGVLPLLIFEVMRIVNLAHSSQILPTVNYFTLID